jgi:hypothetical protein
VVTIDAIAALEKNMELVHRVMVHFNSSPSTRKSELLTTKTG